MNTYRVVVKTASRSEGTPANFNIRFGQVLPNDKSVFKCKVSSMVMGRANLVGVTNIEMGPAWALILVADFPYINYQSTSGDLYPIAFINQTMIYQSHDFLVSNINHRTINFKYVDTDGILVSADDIGESYIVLTFEPL